MDILERVIAKKFYGGSGGAPVNIQPLEVTQNGVYNLTEGVNGYAPVKVYVDGSTDHSAEDWLVTRSISGYYANDRVTTVGSYAFRDCRYIESVSFPNVTSISSNAFVYCYKLVSVNFPKATEIGSDAFSVCSGLTNITFPEVTKVSSAAFENCSKLVSADFPKVNNIGTTVFRYCSVLTSVILRNETPIKLGNVNAFNSTPIANGTGYIYVPAALVDAYKAATNWATYAAQFRALEDYTVDGTITGALDPNKTGV